MQGRAAVGTFHKHVIGEADGWRRLLVAVLAFEEKPIIRLDRGRQSDIATNFSYVVTSRNSRIGKYCPAFWLAASSGAPNAFGNQNSRLIVWWWQYWYNCHSLKPEKFCNQ
jgi:hypothetical protein